MSTINSRAYWDKRFLENWEAFEGPTQSRSFARMAIEHLPGWLVEQIKLQNLSLADWGCGQGDGTDVWNGIVAPGQITGIDFAHIAIEQARRRYPALRFMRMDWLSGEEADDAAFDIVFSSNTLEHFHDARAVLHAVARRARKAVVLALPYRELDRIDEHFFSFFADNIPAQLANGFVLLWSKVVDCSQRPETLWNGQQIVLVYADPQWLAGLPLVLGDLHLEQEDVAAQLRALEAAVLENRQFRADLEAKATDIARLTHEAGAREGEIARLARQASERDASIDALVRRSTAQDDEITGLLRQASAHGALLRAAEDYRHDKEIYIAQLLLDLEGWDRGLPRMARKLQQRLAHRLRYWRRARELLAAGGFKALARAMRAKLRGKAFRQRARMSTGEAWTGLASTSATHAPALLPDELVILAGVPYDDVGGGQRSAQLARCALRTGRRVVYLYLYPKYDFATGAPAASDVQVPGLLHEALDAVDPAELLERISERATVVIEFPHPKVVPFLDACNARGLRTVFELIDDWETSLGGDWFEMDTYRRIVNGASMVVGTARCLVDRLVALGRTDAAYLPNAADETLFDKYKSHARPEDLPARGNKVALYFGSLYGEWFAWEWVVAAANANPGLDIVLIGDSPAIEGLPGNIHLLGARRIEQLPAYLQHADLALLPFVPGRISDAVSPIKVFEYLFAGRRVVSTRLPEVLDYPGVEIADTPEEFARLCGAEAAGDGALDNDRFIANNSWFARLDALVGEGARAPFADSVSAIILIHDNRHIIGRCLASLQQHGRGLLREIIVVDNASSDGGAEYVRTHFPDVRVYENPVNGCASGRNLGVSMSTGRYLAFFDSDQWFTSASGLVEALQILSRDASVGAVGWGAGWFDRTRGDLMGMVADGCPNRAMNTDALRKGYRADIAYLATCGVVMPRSVFDATEGFDTFYDPTCFEDTDLSFQVKRLGLKTCFRDLTGIRHQPHQTTRADSGSDAYRALFLRNGDYFKRKWAAHPEFFLDYPGH